MKQYVLLVGGSGTRLLDALICASAAGVYPAERLEVLLADTDRSGLRGTKLAQAKLADYDRLHRLMKEEGTAFRTELNVRTWPSQLPGGAATLREWTEDSEDDTLLCQALLEDDAVDMDLRSGCHGRRMLGEVMFAGLLEEADNVLDDVLGTMVDEIVQILATGEEVRVVLAGSICGGTGAAGIPMLCRYIQERTRGDAKIGAVLLAASATQEDAALAASALREYAQDGLCSTVCVLGLPAGSRTEMPADAARLTDWLAVYCMDILLHRPAWLEGTFTVRAEEGPLSWSIFGKAEERYRQGYGRLMKAAAAWTGHIGPVVMRNLEHPSLLRDKLFGWYARHFRRMTQPRAEALEDAASLDRLMNVMLLWLGGVCRTLPVDMKNASAMTEARREAEEHYGDLADLAGHLAVMDEEIHTSELYEDTFVHRDLEDEEEDEAEATMRRADAVRLERERRESAQQAYNRRMGGHALMGMLMDMSDEAENDVRRHAEQYAEAVRRIDEAEAVAAPEEQYRITDARQKLKRMEKHMRMLESRADYITAGLARAEADQLRFDPPAMTLSGAENDMFLPEWGDRLLRRDRIGRRELEAMWGSLVRPAQTGTYRQLLKELRRGESRRGAPVAGLLAALVHLSMEEA